MAYDRTAEFHELFIAPLWHGYRSLLADHWGALSSQAVILDVGAGTGVGLLALAGVTAAQLIAIEPDRTMRTALMARLATDVVMAERTTVFTERAPHVMSELPDHLDGALLAHMLGHLDARDREQLWTLLLPRLRPEAMALVTVSPEPDGRAAADGELAITDARWVGEREYTVSYQPHPVHGPERGHLSVYRVHHRGRQVTEEIEIGAWYPITATVLAAEVEAAGGAVLETGNPTWRAVVTRT
ncbi:MAG: class I SAM-dependent methyltransferase [Nakamurella sp.]